jgi:hypothetical protein
MIRHPLKLPFTRTVSPSRFSGSSFLAYCFLVAGFVCAAPPGYAQTPAIPAYLVKCKKTRYNAVVEFNLAQAVYGRKKTLEQAKAERGDSKERMVLLLRLPPEYPSLQEVNRCDVRDNGQPLATELKHDAQGIPYYLLDIPSVEYLFAHTITYDLDLTHVGMYLEENTDHIAQPALDVAPLHPLQPLPGATDPLDDPKSTGHDFNLTAVMQAKGFTSKPGEAQSETLMRTLSQFDRITSYSGFMESAFEGSSGVLQNGYGVCGSLSSALRDVLLRQGFKVGFIDTSPIARESLDYDTHARCLVTLKDIPYLFSIEVTNESPRFYGPEMIKAAVNWKMMFMPGRDGFAPPELPRNNQGFTSFARFASYAPGHLSEAAFRLLFASKTSCKILAMP